MKLVNKFNDILKMGNGKADTDAEKRLTRAVNGPGIAKADLKLAKIYEKRGEAEKALKEYLLTAASFSRNGHYSQALNIYKHVLEQNPNLDKVALKIGEIYGKMGQLENAHSIYGRLLKQYNKRGQDNKAAEVMCLMAELSMHKIEMGKQIQTPAEEPQFSEPTSENAASDNAPQTMSSAEEDTKFIFDLAAALDTNPPRR
jgi:tetratricopeptide (TPR) repeat protein